MRLKLYSDTDIMYNTQVLLVVAYGPATLGERESDVALLGFYYFQLSAT